MNLAQVACMSLVAGALSLGASAVNAHPTFQTESIRDFSAALGTLRTARLNMGRTWTLDSRHADPTRYHAYRFVIPDTVMIGIAKSVTLDAAGHVHIEQEPGAPLSGRANPTHREYSHILVPTAVTPPI